MELHFKVTDTGIGIPAEKQGLLLQGVFPGGQQHHPQIWRHRPWAGDLRSPGRTDGGEDVGGKQPGKGSTFHFTAQFAQAEGTCQRRHPYAGNRVARSSGASG